MERKCRGEYTPVELTTILGEFNEQSLQLLGENERKAAVLEAELELKRRKQEQHHEERVPGMMMSMIQQVARPANTFPQASDPFIHTPPLNLANILSSTQYPPSSGPSLSTL